MAFGDKRYSMFDRTPDSSMVLHAVTTVTTNVTTTGTDLYVGDGAVDIDVVIDCLNYAPGTAGTFKFALIGSSDSGFTNKYVLGFMQLGSKTDIGTATGVTPPNSTPSYDIWDTAASPPGFKSTGGSGGRYLLKATNLVPNASTSTTAPTTTQIGGGTALACPYVRLQVVSAALAGSASMTFRAYAGVEMR